MVHDISANMFGCGGWIWWVLHQPTHHQWNDNNPIRWVWSDLFPQHCDLFLSHWRCTARLFTCPSQPCCLHAPSVPASLPVWWSRLDLDSPVAKTGWTDQQSQYVTADVLLLPPVQMSKSGYSSVICVKVCSKVYCWHIHHNWLTAAGLDQTSSESDLCWPVQLCYRLSSHWWSGSGPLRAESGSTGIIH